MKKLSNRRNNKGFTLIELLATVSVLSLIMVIVIYISVNVINKTKEKGYQITISNIEDISGEYVLENDSRILWIQDSLTDYEYQCVSVQDLIDTGYFKSDVLESYVANDVKVKASDYIYLERNKIDKTLTKNVLLVNDKDTLNKYSGLCSSILVDGNINFGVVPLDWAKKKDITITYKLFNNLDNVSNYSYNYSFDSDINVKKENNFNKATMAESVTVDKNGTINASINYLSGDNILSSSLNINKIDNTVPGLSVSVVGGDVYSQTKTATVILSDLESGFKKGNYQIKYDWSISDKSCDELTKDAVITINKDNDNSGSVDITISDETGMGKLYVCGDNVYDYVGNALNALAIADVRLDNIGPSIEENYTGEQKVGSSVTIPLVVTDEHSGVNADSFTVDDVTVTVGDNTISSITLNKVDDNNYELTIVNYDSSGDLKIVIDKDKVFDGAGNGNNEVEFKPDVIFDNIYTISYDANGGSGAPASQTKKQGIDLTLSSAIPTRTNYIFTGWNTQVNGSGTSYESGGTYSGNTSITLYAQWESHGDGDHVWNAIGNTRLQTAGLFEFTCCYYHNYGYAIYCSKCGMSARHYKTVLHAGEGLKDPAQWSCTCSPIIYSIIWDDSSLKNSNPSIARDNLAATCGLTCGQSLFEKSETGFKKWCTEDHLDDRIVPPSSENNCDRISG